MKTKLILLLFLIVNLVNAQGLGQKWINILELPDQIVYVDTSSIRQVENQISVLSIVFYKQPQTISSLNKEASSTKSQILFNVPIKKYTVIGNLYYDKNLKILGETSLPGFASSSENFSLVIDSSKVMSAIYNKAIEYLNLKNSGNIETNIKSPENKKENKTNTATKKKSEEVKPVSKDSMKALDRVALYLSKKDSVQKAAQQPTEKYIPPTNVIDNTSDKKQTEQKKTAIDSPTLSNEKESNPKSTIFTDGSKYSFQVSSWKNKTKADSEVKRLKAKGHNAFLAEGMVRGATWYRVRIGYFNSIEETEAYMKKFKAE